MDQPERAVATPDPHARGYSACPNPAGWVCPKCQKVWSPYVRRCIRCGMPPQSQTGQQMESRG